MGSFEPALTIIVTHIMLILREIYFHEGDIKKSLNPNNDANNNDKPIYNSLFLIDTMVRERINEIKKTIKLTTNQKIRVKSLVLN